MKPVLIPVSLCALFALAACERRDAAVPTPAPAPAVVPVPGPPGPPGQAGMPGATGASGTPGTTVIVTPPASSASN
jgi:hypothetical protein